MSVKMDRGTDTYGLMLAKRQAREMLAEVKGDRSDYARGWRRACTTMMASIDRAIADFRKANP